MKKLGTCASARKDGRLVEALGCGSSDVMGNLPYEQVIVIKQDEPMGFNVRGSALPPPTYLRPPKHGLRVGGSGFAQAASNCFRYP